MPEVDRRDFIARVAAEASFKEQKRGFGAKKFEPPNYYGQFLLEQLQDLEAAEEERLKDGKRIKLNSKFFRELFYSVWQQRLTEGTRRIYREN